MTVAAAAGLTASVFAQMDAQPTPSAGSGGETYHDRSSFKKAAEASTNEVALSQAAVERASNPDVKAFAEMMVSDHTSLNSDLEALAAKRGVDINEAIEKGKQEDVESLRSKNGAEFDRAYLKYMVEGHKDAASLFDKEAQSTKDGDLADLSIRYLPKILEHLRKAEALYETAQASSQ